MDEYLLFEAFDRRDYIPREQIKRATNYISSQLISWSPNRSYYEVHYNYGTKLYIVYDWKKNQGFASFSKKKENQFVTINL